MRLVDLLSDLPSCAVMGDPTVEVYGIACDSRTVQRGDLFCAIPGRTHDGHAFVQEAVARGAAAALVERPVEVPIPQVIVPSVRRVMGPVCAAFYGHPSHRLSVIGVTGTNGKGAVTYFTRAVLEAGGARCGVIGTLGAFLGDEVIKLPHTTPEAPVLQALLDRMAQRGMSFVAMEVASHALAMHRVDGVRFEAAAFTNLTQDHLDFHGTMEAYRDAKALLFQKVVPDGISVLNRDDPASAYLSARSRAPVRTYGFTEDADVRAEDVRLDLDGCAFTVVAREGRQRFFIPTPGRFNVYNALCAIALGLHFGVPLDAMAARLASFEGIPGRFERVDEGQEFAVIVDYAHTPDGLRRVLETARELTGGQVIVVFGCGGDRDRAKRPQMGRIAATLADRVIVTSDNPRSEDPLRIIEEITSGIPPTARYEVEPDRRAAIRRALQSARPKDAVLICGKGHEDVQILQDRAIPFDDRAEARAALRELGYGRG
jgi:UDP-N-acetylmuramoyl-L-alanyl-D-glutamate--2,6-diaminopimelate ligase